MAPPGANHGAQRWPAPAKLNLMLHITGRREDGYHELQTVFRFLDYADELEFDITRDGVISRLQGAAGVSAEDDLVVRAARALQRETGCELGARIRLHKRIPMGAGLGGGSSDAATTLHVLNREWRLGLDTAALARIGLELGADVPVFVHGFAAFAEGIGEQLYPLSLEPAWYLVLTPHVHVSTAEIFQDLELTRDCPAIKICGLHESGWDNVCVPVVVKHYPEVGEALARLEAFGRPRMSGTGASVFATFGSQHEAMVAQQALVEAGLPETWTNFIARGLNESPLLAKLNR